MKIVFLVEGDTERRALPEFFNRWLNSQVKTPVTIKAAKLKGSGDYRQRFVRSASNYLDEGYAIVGLIDRYQCGIEYADNPGIDGWYRRAKRDLESKVGNRGFRQHFAIHETEAWLLGDPRILPAKVQDALPKIASNPETVDLRTPPARLLSQLYRQTLGRSYRKVSDGAKLFRRLDPELAASKCPHLKLLLDDLLELAQGTR